MLTSRRTESTTLAQRVAAVAQAIGGLRLHENAIAILTVALIAIGVIYVGNYLTPLYGIGAETVGYAGPGSHRRDASRHPQRRMGRLYSLVQAAVNNGFSQLNKSSYYTENMRFTYGLPLLDWGAIFKPQFMPFFIMSAARAYSIYWYLCMAAFIVGYTLLLQRATKSFHFGFAAALAFCFSAGTQLWWTNGPITLALFPFVLLSFDNIRTNAWWSIPAFYLSTVWIISNFYPPEFITLTFVGGIYLLAFRPGWFRPRIIVLSLAVVAAACGVGAWYLHDYILTNLDTVYPGLRRSTGGSLPFQIYLAKFFADRDAHIPI